MNRKTASVVGSIMGLVAPLWVFAQTPPAGGADANSPLSLAGLVQEAMEHNPEILAARRAVEAKRARIPQAGAWADPTVSLSYGGNAFPPFTVMRGDPSSNRELIAEQTIPYPGKTRLRKEIAARDADAESLAYEATTRQVVAEIKQAYFELYYLNHSLATLQKDHEILKELEQATEARYSTGKATQQDVLRAQLELTRLGQRVTMVRYEHDTLLAQINSLRNAAVDAPLGDPGEVKPSTLIYNKAQLQDAAEKSYPVLNQRRTMVDENRLAVDLARKDVRPDFSVGYAYMQRDGMPDMYGITFSASLPIFRHRKQDRAIAEATANLESARQMESKELAALRFQVRQDFLAVQDSEELLKLYTDGIAPQTKLISQSSLAGLETGQGGYSDILRNILEQTDAELDYYRQVADHEKALARLEAETGLDLIQQGETHHD